MSSWGEIKKAVNTTLGTKDFISIDKLLTNENSISGDDNITTLISSETIGTTNSIISLGSFIADYNGEITLSISVKSSNVGDVDIKINNISVLNTDETEYSTFNIKLSVIKGRTYNITMNNNSNQSTTKSYCNSAIIKYSTKLICKGDDYVFIPTDNLLIDSNNTDYTGTVDIPFKVKFFTDGIVKIKYSMKVSSNIGYFTILINDITVVENLYGNSTSKEFTHEIMVSKDCVVTFKLRGESATLVANSLKIFGESVLRQSINFMLIN